MRNRAGLTLIELVVTLTVMSMMVAFVTPALLELSASSRNSSIEPVRLLVRDARRRAARNGSEVELVLALQSGDYRLTERTGGRSVWMSEGRLEMPEPLSPDPAARFRVVFRAGAPGTGDSLVVHGEMLRVESLLGRMEVVR